MVSKENIETNLIIKDKYIMSAFNITVYELKDLKKALNINNNYFSENQIKVLHQYLTQTKQIKVEEKAEDIIKSLKMIQKNEDKPKYSDKIKEFIRRNKELKEEIKKQEKATGLQELKLETKEKVRMRENKNTIFLNQIIEILGVENDFFDDKFLEGEDKINADSIRNYILNNPLSFDIRKVKQKEFIELLKP